MGAPKPTLGYESRTAAVTALRSEGHSTASIAEKLSIRTSAVSALEASSIRKDSRRAEDTGPDGHRPVRLSNESYRLLRPYAARRDVSFDTLVQTIIEIAVSDDIIDAILDDGKAE